MPNPTVTVLICAYNGEAFIAEAIESVLTQTFQDFEIIVVDDASTDGTAQAVKRFKDGRIRRLVNEKNLGHAGSLNRGMAEAVGEYVAILDCDDRCFPTRLERQTAFLDDNPEYVLCGSWSRTFGSWDLERRYPTDYEALRASLLFECPIVTPSVMFRREMVRDAGMAFDSSCPLAFDYKFWIEASRHFPIANLEEFLVAYRLHPAQISSRKREKQKSDTRTVAVSLLRELLPEISEAEIDLHLDVFFMEPIASVDEIDRLRTHFGKIYEANRKQNRYVQSEFLKILNKKWFEAGERAGCGPVSRLQMAFGLPWPGIGDFLDQWMPYSFEHYKKGLKTAVKRAIGR
jgi:glycosyltransferase involved in cell wall biosynthesis